MRIPLLSVMVLLPAAGAVGVLVLGGRRITVGRLLGWAVAVVEVVLACGLFVLLLYDKGETGGWTEYHAWVPHWGVAYSLRADGLSVPFLCLTALLGLAALCGVGEEREPGVVAGLLALESGIQGTLLARDAVLLVVFWQATLIVMAYLVGREGKEGREVAVSVLGYGSVGSLTLLLAILWLALDRLELTGVLSFSIPWLTRGRPTWAGQAWLFGAFLFAFLGRAGLWPLHRWLVASYGRMGLAGVLLVGGAATKVGLYGLMRFCVALLPDPFAAAFPALVVLAGVGFVHSAVAGVREEGLRRRLALFGMTPMWVAFLGVASTYLAGLQGAVVVAVAHGVALAGWVAMGSSLEREHAGLRMKDLQAGVPAGPWAGATLLFSLTWLGFPGTAGFVGLMLVVVSLSGIGWWAGVVVAAGAAGLGGAMMVTWHGLMSGSRSAPVLTLSAGAVGVVLGGLVLTVWMGLVSPAFTARSQGTLTRITAQSMVRRTIATGMERWIGARQGAGESEDEEGGEPR